MTDFKKLYDVIHSAEHDVTLSKEDAVALLDDAANWRAFYNGTDRFKMIGSANIDHGEKPHLNPKIRDPEKNVHFGLEVWDGYPSQDDVQSIHGRRVLDAYVEHNRKKLFSGKVGKKVDVEV